MKEFNYIFRAWITTKDGERVYAKDHGKRAFRIPVERMTSDKAR